MEEEQKYLFHEIITLTSKLGNKATKKVYLKGTLPHECRYRYPKQNVS